MINACVTPCRAPLDVADVAVIRLNDARNDSARTEALVHRSECRAKLTRSVHRTNGGTSMTGVVSAQIPSSSPRLVAFTT